ncbi:MAG: threonine synthase [Sediminibacterium sp.]
MNFYNIQNPSFRVSFEQATLMGQAPSRGLFFPESIPTYSPHHFSRLLALSREELAFEIMQPYVNESIPDNVLREIVIDTINFPTPIVAVNLTISALELFHGPTWAFKDVGARFMSRCLGYFYRHQHGKITVLVATSGDTGGAVANGFLDVEGVEVIILYPIGKVSPVQEMQLTTCGKNVTALAINGSFDDCQSMVKEAFMDVDVSQQYQLTSANSINIARWLPQQLYYFFAIQQWEKEAGDPVIAVPSGNFGNLAAGLVARRSGLPVAHFIAACNANDAVARFLQGETYSSRTSVPTISNAMDVGDPSNFIRILELFHHDFSSVRQMVTGNSISDAATLACIQRVYETNHYLLDPHGAVAFQALEDYLSVHTGTNGIFLATAHPVKFPDVIHRTLGIDPVMPDAAKDLFSKKSSSIQMEPNYSHFKSWMLNR